MVNTLFNKFWNFVQLGIRFLPEMDLSSGQSAWFFALEVATSGLGLFLSLTQEWGTLSLSEAGEWLVDTAELLIEVLILPVTPSQSQLLGKKLITTSVPSLWPPKGHRPAEVTSQPLQSTEKPRNSFHNQKGLLQIHEGVCVGEGGGRAT